MELQPASTALSRFKALALAELVDREEYKTPHDRYRNRPALNAEIDLVTRTKDTQEWIDLMNEVGVPCGPIYSLDQTFDDPQIRHLQIAQNVESPALGPTTIIGQPIHMTRTPNRMVSASPECGEQTEEVLAEFGYGAERIAELRERKII